MASTKSQSLLNSSVVLEAFSLWLSATSLVAVGLLCVEIFDPLRAAAGGFFLTCLFWNFRPVDAAPNLLSSESARHTLPALALLALALFFRADPYLWVGGGQDQGVYVSMASHYAEAGSPFITDAARESLSAELAEKYDHNNIIVLEGAEFVVGEYEGKFLPGVYVKSIEQSQYVFQFYPVHPLWMAIVGTAFGEYAYTYSLPFFGVLSILFFFCILREITKHSFISLLGASILCFSPAHTFFSKFPTSEVVSLSFFLGGIYFLLRGCSATTHTKARGYFLGLSFFSLASMFFTHINGFMFVPFIIFGFCYNEILGDSSQLKRALRFYLLAVATAYGLSVLYGFHFSYPYSSAIYEKSFSPLLGDSWQQYLLLLMLISAAICGACFWIKETRWPNLHGRISLALESVLASVPLVLFLTMLISGYLIYQLATGTPLGDEIRFTHRWPGISGTGWDVVPHWSLFVFVAHLSPGIATFLLLCSFRAWQKSDSRIKLLGLGVAIFFFYVAVLKWFVPFQYYFVRYQLAQLLPLTLAFATLLFHSVLVDTRSRSRKLIAAILFISAVPYSLAITSKQIGFQEQAGLLETLKSIEAEAGEHSFVLINAPVVDSYGAGLSYPYAGELRTSLMFHTSLKPISVSSEDQESFADFLCAEGFKVSQISAHKSSLSARQFEILAPRYARKPSIFLKEDQATVSPIFVEKVDCVLTRSNRLLKTGIVYEKGVIPYAVVEGLNSTADFSGDRVTFDFHEAIPARGHLTVKTLGYTPQEVKEDPKFVQVRADGELLECGWDVDWNLHCDLTGRSNVSNLTFDFQLWQPVQYGINLDTNFYGLDIKSVQITKD